MMIGKFVVFSKIGCNWASYHASNQSRNTHQILRGKPSNVEGKTTGQTRSIHYKKNRDYNTKVYAHNFEYKTNWGNTRILIL